MVMSNKVNIQTESIEVPVAIAAGTPSVIAREVKLFINLLQTGEIDSLSSLLASAGLDNKPALFDLTNLDDIWKAVASKICPPTTQALLLVCQLINEQLVSYD